MIIGVVAAIAIPSLLLSNQKNQHYTAFMKSFNTLSNAINLSVAQNGAINTWNLPEDYSNLQGKKDVFDRYLRKYLNVVEECTSANDFCNLGLDAFVRKLDGEEFATVGDSLATIPCYRLADGSVLCLEACLSSVMEGTEKDGVIQFVIATGKQRQIGKDIFTNIIFAQDGTFAPFPADFIEGDCTPSTKDTGLTCASYILKYGNMDYLD